VSLVALGVGSMGYAPRGPYQNYGTTGAYFRHLDARELPIETMDVLTPEMELLRQVITQLRFARVNLRGVREKYGADVQIVFSDLLRALGELGLLVQQGDEILLSKAAAPYNNVLPMLFSPDSFKEDLLGLPADYLAAMPIPLVLTRIGATQSAPLDMGSFAAGAKGIEPVAAGGLHPDGSCPVVDDGNRARARGRDPGGQGAQLPWDVLSAPHPLHARGAGAHAERRGPHGCRVRSRVSRRLRGPLSETHAARITKPDEGGLGDPHAPRVPTSTSHSTAQKMW
jgi:hypothetical protein